MIIHPGYVGIDVSKHHLDVFDAVNGARRIANTAEAIAALVAGLAGGDFVVFEATGAYDRALARALSAAGVRHARVNPGRARDFARAAGFLAKTDQVDARMLAAMAQCLQPPAEPAVDPERERLARLGKRRDQLVATRQQERTRRRECLDAAIAADLDRHLGFLDAAIAALDKAIKALIAGSARLAAAARLLRSAPGIGPVASATLLALLPELGSRSPKTVAALVGIAPFNADSGTSHGRKRIRGGRKRVRDALYMATVAAARSNTSLADFYNRLRRAGRATKYARIALARKLLVVLNAMLRDQTCFHA